MNFSIRKKENHTLVTVNSENLDTFLAPDLKAVFLKVVEAGETNILVDMIHCKHCDPSGLGALLLGNRLCLDAGGNLVLVGISPRIREMMDLIGLDSLLKVIENEEEAYLYFD